MKHQFWTTTDGKWFLTEAFAQTHQREIDAANDPMTRPVKCGCGTVRTNWRDPCPNVACHQERLDLLTKHLDERVRIFAEYRAARSQPGGHGWMSNRAAEKWAARVAILCHTDVREMLTTEIANYERQIAEERATIARLIAPRAQENAK